VSYLCAGVGTAKENTGGLTSEGAGSARLAKIAEALDDVLNGALLAEAGLPEGRKSDKND
jgi:hypothetical protein